MTIEQQAELARIVYPDKKWLTSNDSVFYEGPGTYDYDNIYFNPSLTGEDWQKAQALDVIVAALNLGKSACLRKCQNGQYQAGVVIGYGGQNHNWTEDDLLTAAARAILGGGE